MVEAAENDSYSVEVSPAVSDPFIVITNESQWSTANALLLSQIQFGTTNKNDNSVSADIVEYLNKVNWHLAQITTQKDSSSHFRILNINEINAIHTKYFGKKKKKI